MCLHVWKICKYISHFLEYFISFSHFATFFYNCRKKSWIIISIFKRPDTRVKKQTIKRASQCRIEARKGLVTFLRGPFRKKIFWSLNRRTFCRKEKSIVCLSQRTIFYVYDDTFEAEPFDKHHVWIPIELESLFCFYSKADFVFIFSLFENFNGTMDQKNQIQVFFNTIQFGILKINICNKTVMFIFVWNNLFEAKFK